MIRIARIRDVKMPCRKTVGAAGIDFYMPKIDELFIRDFKAKEQNQHIDVLDTAKNALMVPPRSQALIPSGIVCEIPEGFALIAHNKSGVSTKKQVIFVADVVDDDYRGELHLSIFNLNDKNVIFEEGDPVVQFILTPIFKDEIHEFSLDDVFTRGPSARGAGGFGSTGS